MKRVKAPAYLRVPLTFARQMRGLSYRDIAAVTGLNKNAPHDLERGLSDPYLSTVVALGAAVGLRLQWAPMEQDAP